LSQGGIVAGNAMVPPIVGAMSFSQNGAARILRRAGAHATVDAGSTGAGD
jgi:hypothetical protein